MALPATCLGEIRTTGSNLNSGYFKPGGSGTDYSQQDSPHVTFDGSTIAASTSGTTTTITITGYTVLATDVDNTVRIAGGSGFTAGIYHISSVNTGANTWTFDRNCCSGASSGMTGRMGGAIATFAQVQTDMGTSAGSNGVGCYVKASGTYTFTSTITIIGSGGSGLLGNFFIGYTSSRTDNGKPTVTTATNSTNLFEFTQSHLIKFSNFAFTNTATTRAACMVSKTTADSSLVCENCTFSGFSSAVLEDWSTTWAFRPLQMYGCEVKNSTGSGVRIVDSAHFFGCYIHDNTSHGILLDSGSDTTAVCDLQNTVLYNNGGSGVLNSGNQSVTTTAYKYIRAINCTIIGNAVDGVTEIVGAGTLGSALIAFNTIFWGNGVTSGTGYGVNTGGSNNFTGPISGGYNAYGGNQTGARNLFPAFSTDITLSASPVTNAAGNDFSLNSTTGGGAACKGAGGPGYSLFGTGGWDIGAVQSAGGSSSTIIISQTQTNHVFQDPAYC